eukprot:scpid93342/ scgid6000/ Apoptosis-related protein 3
MGCVCVCALVTDFVELKIYHHLSIMLKSLFVPLGLFSSWAVLAVASVLFSLMATAASSTTGALRDMSYSSFKAVCTGIPGCVDPRSVSVFFSDRCFPPVAQRSRHHQSLSQIGRCCVENGTSVIGMDLNGCSATVNADQQQWLRIPQTVQWIDVSNTTNGITFGGNFTAESNVPAEFLLLKGLASLEYLVLPADTQCPGPNGTWKQVIDNSTVTVCSEPVSACSLQGALVYLGNQSQCSATSDCVPNGPGFRRCECRPGYRGYQCLRKGHFSYGNFFAAIIATVLAIIAVPLLDRLRWMWYVLVTRLGAN